MKNLVKLTSMTILDLFMPGELVVRDPLGLGQFLDIPLLVGVLESTINNKARYLLWLQSSAASRKIRWGFAFSPSCFSLLSRPS